MNGQQFLGNTRSKEVHDLDNEGPACQVEKIIDADHDKPFILLSTAHAQGYDNCADSGRKRSPIPGE